MIAATGTLDLQVKKHFMKSNMACIQYSIAVCITVVLANYDIGCLLKFHRPIFAKLT